MNFGWLLLPNYFYTKIPISSNHSQPGVPPKTAVSRSTSTRNLVPKPYLAKGLHRICTCCYHCWPSLFSSSHLSSNTMVPNANKRCETSISALFTNIYCI